MNIAKKIKTKIKKKLKAFKKFILIFAGIILLTSGLVFYLDSAPFDMQEEKFYVKEGDSINKIAARLKEKNLIRNDKFFAAFAILTDQTRIMKGKYKISKSMPVHQIVSMFYRGDILTRKVTIPEGFNIYEIGERLKENEVVNDVDFITYATDSDSLRSIGIFFPSAEGLLFPDTYIFPEESTPKEVIVIMYKRMKNILSTIDSNSLKKINMDTYKMLTLASLIESEAKVPNERIYISGVFHSRLKKRIRLGCDPTVRYAVKNFKDRITYKDLRFNSPYNTYLRAGLPPTPICSPGRECILATLSPANTDFLYFVARNDGSHYFSKTLKEHNVAVDFYQKGINNGFKDNQKL